MATKKTVAMLLISMLVVMACANVGEALSECAKQCMPTCMKTEGATLNACGPACEGYCVQITGNTGGYSGWPVDDRTKS
ncbi:hypothetical protein FCV25MIE_08432 [Fagus crenata]